MFPSSDENSKENVDPLPKSDIASPDIYAHRESPDSEGPLKRAKLSENRERAERASEPSSALGSLESKEERARRKQAEDMLWELCQDCDAHLVRVTRKPGRGRRRKISPDEEAALKAIPSVIHLHGKGQSSSRITIGRQSNLVDVVIEPVVKGVSEYIISRKHAVVEKKRVDGGGDFLWMIEDTNSLNGVFVNNVKRKKCVLKDDDTIIFGGGGSLKDGERFVQNDSKFIYKFKLMKSVRSAHPLEGSTTGAAAELASPKRAKARRRRKAVLKAPEESVPEKPSGTFDEQVSSIIKEIEKQRSALLTLEKAVGGLNNAREAAGDKGLSSSDAHVVSLFGAELYCSVCNDLFVDPVIVPCGHCFCKVCVLERVVGGDSRCPTCLAGFKGTAEIYPALTVVSCVRVCVGLLPDSDKTVYESRIKAYDLRVRELLEARTDVPDKPKDDEKASQKPPRITKPVSSMDDETNKKIQPQRNVNDDIQQPQNDENNLQQQSQNDENNLQQQPQNDENNLQQKQQSQSQRNRESQKSPRKSKMPRSSQASPKTTGKKKKRASPMKAKKPQLQMDDATRAQRLREAIERAKKRGTKFLDITEPWEEDDKQTFLKGLSNYSSPLLRTIYCEMIGLTQEWVETTGVKDMLTAVNNLSLNCDASNIQELRKVLNDYISCGGQHKISSFFKSV